MNQENSRDELVAVIDATRALFHRLKAAADEAHHRGPMTAGLRGVLQDLQAHGPRTVPTMARARPVSRQLIQTLVNRLLDEGYVELIPNPAHKRSKLVRLTDDGRDEFEAMRRRESRMLARLPVTCSEQQMAEAAGVLRDLRRAFEDPSWGADRNAEEGDAE